MRIKNYDPQKRNNSHPLMFKESAPESQDAGMDLLEACKVLLDHVDYTVGNCGLTEMVGAVLPKEIIQKARAAIARAEEGEE